MLSSRSSSGVNERIPAESRSLSVYGGTLLFTAAIQCMLRSGCMHTTSNQASESSPVSSSVPCGTIFRS